MPKTKLPRKKPDFTRRPGAVKTIRPDAASEAEKQQKFYRSFRYTDTQLVEILLGILNTTRQDFIRQLPNHLLLGQCSISLDRQHINKLNQKTGAKYYRQVITYTTPTHVVITTRYNRVVSVRKIAQSDNKPPRKLDPVAVERIARDVVATKPQPVIKYRRRKTLEK